MFSICSEEINPEFLKHSMIEKRAGALVTFEGWVREQNEGLLVASLKYECYEELALKEGALILAAAKNSVPVLEIKCQHRIGLLKVGDLAVWVGVTAQHRADAFTACRLVIDQIKLRLPIWKRETYGDGSSLWVNCHQQAKNHDQ